MNMRTLFGRKRLLVVAVGLLAAGAGDGAFAAFPQSDVKSYTGCLTNGVPGVIAFVGEGDVPLRPCPAGMKEIHLSGGDITSLSVGPGLTGGGSNGAVSIGLDTKSSLPQACGGGSVPKWNGATAAWQCGGDNDTTYNAGVGLSLLETPPPFETHLFGIEQGYRLPQGCAVGDVPRKASGGGWLCGAAAAPGASHAYIARGSALIHDFVETEIVSLTVPAGSYVISGKVTLFNNDDDGQYGSCSLSTGDTMDVGLPRSSESGVLDQRPIPLQDAATFDTETTITLTCATFWGTVSRGVLTAVSVGGIN